MIYLTKIDPAQNTARFFVIDLQPTLVGEWALMKEWGRVGRRRQERQVFYGRESETDAALVKELKRWKARRYHSREFSKILP